MRTNRTYMGLLALSLIMAVLAVPSALASHGAPRNEAQLSVGAQGPTDELEGDKLEVLIESLANLIEEHYIFEDVTREIGESLR